jgi:predicted branched-subunit amino acid permease
MPTIRRQRDSGDNLAMPWRDFLKHEHVRRGATDMMPMGPGIAAWGLVTGIAMVKSGLSAPLALWMSLVVYSGSAQLATLPLLVSGAPIGVVWATALCVNLRFVIYSASWRGYFGHLPRLRRLALTYFAADLNMIVFQRAYPKAVAQSGQVPYFLGGALGLWFVWQASSVAGIALAHLIPTHWGLGFAGTLAMLGLVYGLLADRGSWIAAVVAGVAAVSAFGLPLKLNILIAIAAAVAAGVLSEQADRTVRNLRGARE